jgi:hypothetical protein
LLYITGVVGTGDANGGPEMSATQIEIVQLGLRMVELLASLQTHGDSTQELIRDLDLEGAVGKVLDAVDVGRGK